MGPLNPSAVPSKRMPLFPPKVDVGRLRLSIGLPLDPPDPARSSLMEAPTPAPAPRPVAPAPVAQKPAATNPKAQARATQRAEWQKFRDATVTRLIQAGLDEDQALQQTTYLWAKRRQG